MGDPARDDPKPPTWKDIKAAARGLTDKAVAGIRNAKAADVVGGAVVLGGMLVADSALRAIGVQDGLPVPEDAAANNESLDGYVLFLTPARLVLAEIGSALVERPLSMPKYWSRVRAVAQWTPEALASAGLRFTREGAGRTERWRLALGPEPGAQRFDFGAHLKAHDNLAQAAAIAARVAALAG